MTYEERLERIVSFVRKNSGTAGSRALAKIVRDLEGDGPIGELMFSLDQEFFNEVIALLVEFRVSGRYLAFNSIHSNAREAVKDY